MLYRGYIVIMEKKMETTITGYIMGSLRQKQWGENHFGSVHSVQR